MKLLHTSDWHVGKTLKGRSRLDEQKAVLAEIVQLAIDHEVDAVLIAGDVYENVSPTADAQKLVVATLLKLTRAGIEVIAIAGNHDHGPTFEAYRPLMRQVGIRLIGSPRPADQGGVHRFRARSTGEEAVVATLPFLSQRYAVRAAQVITQTPAENVGAYDQMIRDVLANLTGPFGDQTVNLAMAHLTVLGGRLGGGEREAQSIMEYSVPAAIFPIDAHYVALGHLHRRQSVPAAAPVHYSGAPLAVDFGEQDNTNVVCLIEVAPDTPARVTDLPITAGRRLRTVTGTVDQLLADPDAYGEDFLRLRVAQAAYAGMREQLLEALPNALEIRLEPQFSISPHTDKPRRSTASRTPAELFADYCAASQVDDPRVNRLFDELHDDLTSGEGVTVRPVRLDLSGFAAFRDPTVVDFTDADYFALTGPTGSGKSTVIDGLTFALYGSAPRWGRENAIQYALAPTANRCTVRLVFDVAGQRYVAAREVRRIGKQIAQRNSRLERYADPAATGDPETDEPTESLAADPKAVRQQVTELLGLDFEDFCTCVVLPQGDFATFLQASVGQRQDILLKLLGARHYDAIGRLAGRRANDARARVDALTGELAGYGEATEQAETAARRREEELVALLATVTDDVTVVTRLAQEREVTATAASRANEELTRLDDVVAPANIDEQQLAVTAAEEGYREASDAERLAAAAALAAEEALRSGPERGWLEETLRWHAELTDAAGRTAAAAVAEEDARLALDGAGRAATLAREALETGRATHDRQRVGHDRSVAAVTELTGRVTTLRGLAPPTGAGDLDAAVTAARVAWQAARRDLVGAEAALVDARATVAALPERSAIAAQLRTLAEYQTTLVKLTSLRTKEQTSGQQVIEAEAAVVGAAAAHRRAADEVEIIRSQAVAADLRPHLQVGHACPVCTQTVAQLPAPLSVPALAVARTALSESERRRTEAETTSLRLQTVQTALATQITEAVDRLAALDQTLVADLPEQPAGADRDPSRDRAVLSDLGGRVEAAAEQERTATATRDTVRSSLQLAEEEGNRLAAAAQQGWADFHATNGRLAALGAPTITADALGVAWAELLSWAGALTAGLTTEDLPAAQSVLDSAEQALRESAEQLDAAITVDLAAREALTAATLADDKARSELAALTSRIAERQELLADRPGADATRRLLDEHRQVDEQATLTRSRAQQAAVARQQAETVRDRRRTEQQTARAQLLQVRDGFAGLAVPALDPDDLPRAWAELTGWADLQARRRRAELDGLAADLTRLDAELVQRFGRVRDLLAEHAIDRPDGAVPTDPSVSDAASRMARIPTLVELQLERARAATTSVVERRAAAGRLQTKITTDTETEQVSRTLQQLMSAKRFPQWLADAALDTLVADASSSLLQLSGGQFELTHDRGEFFVIDHADADSRRSVKTLSGGETFQASLALALALSEQLATLAAGGRTTLDSIFLDEGFGTLDPDALEIVAGTLENLAQGNRMVGVVTHVTALAERVPIRFEVSRDSRTSSIERIGP